MRVAGSVQAMDQVPVTNETDAKERASGSVGRRWHLFAPGHGLPPGLWVVYATCLIGGATAIFLVSFAMVLEITTSPRMQGVDVGIALLCAIGATVHVVREARSTRRVSFPAWVSFGVAMSLLLWELHGAINDQTAKTVFSLMSIAGSLLLLAGRLVLTLRRGDRP